MVEQQTLTQLEVETKDGPVHRLLKINETHVGFQSSKSRRWHGRSNSFVIPASSLRSRNRTMRTNAVWRPSFVCYPAPSCFSTTGGTAPDVRLSFRPDPAFIPPTMESKALQSMAGTILVNPQQKRLAHLNGHLVENVDFGFGILGGSPRVARLRLSEIQVSSSHWKTTW